MPYFPALAQVPVEKLKVNAEKGYYTEIIEISYRYLMGTDGCNKSVAEAIKCLKGIVDGAQTRSYYIRIAIKLYVQALLISYLEENTKEEVIISNLLPEAMRLLNEIIQDKEFELATEEQQYFKLLEEVASKTKDSKYLISYLKQCIHHRNSFFACYQLTNYYSQGKENFQKDFKKATAYYIKSLFLDNNELFHDKSPYGKNREEYLKNISQTLIKNSGIDRIIIACWCITALALLTDTVDTDSYRKQDKIKAILQSDLVKNSLNIQPDYSYRFKVGSIIIDISDSKNMREIFLRLALINGVYPTVAMIARCYKEALISDALFNDILDQVTKGQLSLSGTSYVNTPASQIDKLRLSFFATKYNSTQAQDASQHHMILLKLAEPIMEINSIKLKANQLSLISAWMMELIVNNHPDGIAKAKQVYAKYGKKITIGTQFKEQGLKKIIEDKCGQLNRAKLQLVVKLLTGCKEALNKLLFNEERKSIIPKTIDKLLQQLESPELLVSQEIHCLFDKQQLKSFVDTIELVCNEIKSIAGMSNYLNQFKQYFNDHDNKQLLQEIEAANTACQSISAVENHLNEFKDKLKNLGENGWKEEVIELMEEQHAVQTEHSPASNKRKESEQVEPVEDQLSDQPAKYVKN